jgi:AAA15 family ATPase/GTPase
MRYARDYNNQVFMTTHSKEFLQALLTEFGDTEQAFLAEQVRVMTLREGESGVLCRALTGQEALDALDRGLELRL